MDMPYAFLISSPWETDSKKRIVLCSIILFVSTLGINTYRQVKEVELGPQRTEITMKLQ